MNDPTTDLDAQIAQRLFGWTCDGSDWTDAEHLWHRGVPAYTTDPAATAQVWQWLETQVHALEQTGMTLSLVSTAQGGWTYLCFLPGVDAQGATWQKALCRAALALADALEAETR